MSFKEVFLKAVDEARSSKQIGPFEAMRARMIANNPRRLAEVQKKCCEQAEFDGMETPSGSGDAAFDWNTFFEMIIKYLPIILAFFNKP